MKKVLLVAYHFPPLSGEKENLVVESNVAEYDRKVLTAKLAKVFQHVHGRAIIHKGSNSAKPTSKNHELKRYMK
jgi:hypothetical protein